MWHISTYSVMTVQMIVSLIISDQWAPSLIMQNMGLRLKICQVAWRALPKPLLFMNILQPVHDILTLIALSKLSLQTRMRAHLLLPYVMCANSEGSGRLRGCAGSGRAVSPEPSLFAYAISTIISWAGLNKTRLLYSNLVLFACSHRISFSELIKN